MPQREWPADFSGGDFEQDQTGTGGVDGSFYRFSQCPVTGKILSAGAFSSSVQMGKGSGVRFAAGTAVTVEQIAERFPEIISMKDARYFENATENVIGILSALVEK